MAIDSASLGSLLSERPELSTRTLAARVGGTSSTNSPASTSRCAKRYPRPPADSMAQVRFSNGAAHESNFDA